MRTAFILLLLLTTCSFAADYPGSPAAVVAAYIEADGEGKALSSDTSSQVLQYTTWPEAPGWDSMAVIKSYDIGEVGRTGNEANVQITYTVVGQLEGFNYTAKPAKEAVDFELVKTKGKWKIASPQLPPHLTVAGAATFLKASGREGEAALKALRARD
jgi:hypothetical protein